MYPKFVNIFDWKDLDEHTLKISVMTGEFDLGGNRILQTKLVVGFDIDTAVGYVLYEDKFCKPDESKRG